MLDLLSQPAREEIVKAIRRLAKQCLPLGEIASRLDLELGDVRTIADMAKITLVRDNRTGAPRTIMAHRAAAASYVAKMRQGFVAKEQHARRLAKAPPLTPEQEQEAIARFIAEKGVTKCITVHLEPEPEMQGRGSVSVYPGYSIGTKRPGGGVRGG